VAGSINCKVVKKLRNSFGLPSVAEQSLEEQSKQDRKGLCHKKWKDKISKDGDDVDTPPKKAKK
jgi:hypothetical protein